MSKHTAATANNWKAGDLFFKPQWPTRIYRVHRRRGTTLWYLGNAYGHNAPRGILRHAHCGCFCCHARRERTRREFFKRSYKAGEASK